MKLQALGRYRLDGEILGKGNFARVELATHSVLNAKVAIKIIDVDKVKEDYVRRNLGREVKVLSRLRHPNIVRLYETMMSGHLYCLVMEYAPGGDLSSLVKAQKEGRFPEGRARPFCRQLVSSLTYMHGRGIIHRDLKMENIMLNSTKDTLKIVDFGLSNCWSPESPLKSHCGSPEYAAPELFVVGRTYGPEIDVWSMGVVFYVLLVGRLPFLSSKQEGLSRQERRDRLIAHINQGLGGTHRSDMRHLGSECRRLLTKVLEPLPARRLTLRHVAVHPWITHKGLSPLTAYQHPRVGNREHQAAVNHMSDLLSIKPQLIEERVLKQMYDDIAGMYNILTNRSDVLQATSLPEEARIRPLELRTPAKRPLTSSAEAGSPPLRSDRTVRPAVAVPLRPAAAAGARPVLSEARSGLAVPRSGVSLRERPRPVARRPAHLARPTTAPAARPGGRDEAAPVAAPAVAARATPSPPPPSPPPPLQPPPPPPPASVGSSGRRRPTAAVELLRTVHDRLGREEAAALRARSAVTPTSGRASASTSGSSERAWGSPRQRASTKTVWADAPWDTPRRHNLTDDQKVRTDDRYESGGSRRAGDKSLLLLSAAEDEFSSLYDDFTDDSSAADEPIRVVIRSRPAEGGVVVDGGVAPGRAAPAPVGRAGQPRCPRPAAPDERQQRSVGTATVRHVGVTRFDGGEPQPEPAPRPPARKSPSESQKREPPAGGRGALQRRRSALPLAKCTLRSPLKQTSSAHAWLSAPGGGGSGGGGRGSGSWSSHDRLDVSAGREGRHQAAPPPADGKAGLRESQTQTAAPGWRHGPADSRSQMLRYMVQTEDLVPAYGVAPYPKKKFTTPHRLYGNVAKRSERENGSFASTDAACVPRGKYRPQTVAAGPGHEKPRSRTSRPNVVTTDDRARAEPLRVKETRVWEEVTSRPWPFQRQHRRSGVPRSGPQQRPFRAGLAEQSDT